MFLNELYSISNFSSTSETISAEICFDAGHSIFGAHFPGAPVVPGVVQLQIVKEILENHLNQPIRLKMLKVCKFLKIIDPEKMPSVYIDIKFARREFLEVVASGSSGSDVYFKAQISYIEQ